MTREAAPGSPPGLSHGPPPGVRPLGDGRFLFRVWAPLAERVELVLEGPPRRAVPMEPAERGHHEARVSGLTSGALYSYRLDGGPERPDPASRFQPRGVGGPSAIVDPGAFEWTDAAWKGLPLERCVFYELHVGTFTPEGTFDAVIPHLDDLAALGVTAIELMPVAQFPGARNWGYDGVQPWAVQDTYGGPEGLARLVDACHARGLAAALDVVTNHLGPEGNFLPEFGPYVSERHRTPWGAGMNFDGPGSDEVRAFFIHNALSWITDYRFDALRLDAIHGIVDTSASPFLAELADAVRERALALGRAVHVIAESDLNDVRVLWPRERGGLGHDAQWSDDFHHALHTVLTGERRGYYADFGRIEQLVRAHTEGFVHDGGYSPYRRRRHGSRSTEIPARQFVVFAQNHDQVGNRAAGDRLSALVSFEALKLAAGVVLLSPFVPLLFMGEEYGETAPFLYFVSHSDPGLVEAVRKGRRAEFAAFGWEGEIPDPQDEGTFRRSRPDRSLREQGRHRALSDLHAELLRLRRETPALARPSKSELRAAWHPAEGGGAEADGAEGKAGSPPARPRGLLAIRRGGNADGVLMVYNFAREEIALDLPGPDRPLQKRLDSADGRWGGPGGPAPQRLEAGGTARLRLAPESFVLFA